MTKRQALELFYQSLSHCEGIQELKDAGIDVLDLQNKLDNSGLFAEDETNTWMIDFKNGLQREYEEVLQWLEDYKSDRKVLDTEVELK